MREKFRLLKKLGRRIAEGSTSEAESSEAASPVTLASPRPERFGLMSLSEPSPDDPAQYPIDIVAVHGLAGDAYTTWTHENGVLWLRDLLPCFLPGCRVFTYGYPSQVAFRTSFAQVQEYARGLVISVRDAQEDSTEALIFAHEDNGVYGRLLKSVAGVVFLGTPHKGSNAATLGTLVGRIVNTFVAATSAGFQTRLIRTDLLDYLSYDSKHLQDLGVSVRNRLADLAVVSFYESEAQYPLSVLEASLPSHPQSNVCIFFCDDKISKQRDAKCALIGLILQLVHRHRSLIRHASKTYEMHGQSTTRSFTALWNLFIKTATDPRFGPTYVIIDGLDECDITTRSSLIESIGTFVQTMEHSITGKNSIKFVLTSRPFLAELKYSNVKISEQRIPIDEGQGGYEEDVRAFIQQKVHEMSQQRNFPSEVQDFLQRTLYSQSGQTFLWVHMVLVSLEKSPVSSRKDLQNIIARLPTGLETTYLRFLSAIPPGYEGMASKLLKLILGSSRPLSLDEINIALTIGPSYHTTKEVSMDCQIAMQHTLQGVLGPLVRVFDSKVALVHQSAKEFLLHHLGSSEELSTIRAFSAEDCTLAIASACIDYLLLDDFSEDIFNTELSPTSLTFGSSVMYENSPVSASPKPFWDEDTEDLNVGALFEEPDTLIETTRQLLVSKHAFFRYSSLHWVEHFAACETSAPIRLREAANKLLDKNTAHCSNWLQFFTAEKAATANENLSIPGSLSTTALAAYFNLHETLKSCLSSQNPFPQADKDCALFWAAEQGHSGIVETLLRAGADPNAQVSDRQTALLAASRNGHLDCVVTLLACDRTDLNIRGKSGRTALSFACGNGYVEIVKTLLRRRDCKADEGDDSGATALFWAVGGGHTQIISLLVRATPPADVNHRDKKGRTTLSWAAGDGMDDDVIGTLLKLRGIDVNAKDDRGRSPLSWAAGNGCAAAVRNLMRDRRVDKASVDNDGRNAISWASGPGHVDALRMLLKYGCPGVDDRCADGWSPLAWATQNNSPDLVETLVSTRCINLEQGDFIGRTALSWAVEYGHLEVVRALLRAGANANSSTKSGETPLATAERLGRTEIRKELIFYMESAQEQPGSQRLGP
ncbi:Ankyrin repeat domain-containing protein 50 [Madurella mycetomatis]|uniref:Ankyrin repeat domain-containing protein 50 n=1 Tax=Madurella mycetomatis TaxID=100816 RepID=A0A175VQ70_9PEZI|nr:Ankyrin repeat domain-containing protein 50 [Madurella mycetomatis]